MARPRKSASEKRIHIVPIRLTEGELQQLKKLAQDAGLPYGRYARETILGRRPKARPAQARLLHLFLNELVSITSNFGQLARATGDDGYVSWAKFVGGQLVEHVVGRDDIVEVIENQLDAINAAGHQVNALARKANSDQQFTQAERIAAFRALTAALDPIRTALQPKNNKKAILDYPEEF